VRAIQQRRLTFVLVFIAFLAVYAATAAPGLLFGDSAELQAAAATAGIPHATGYPTFVMVGWLFTRPPVAEPATLVNLMSAVFGALSVALLIPTLAEIGVGSTAAVVIAVTYGLSFTPWRIALRGEVYTLAICLALLAVWRFLVARRTGRSRDIRLAGFLLGLTLTGHLCFILPVAILGLALAWQVFRSEPRPVPQLVLLLLAFLAGLTPYLFIPLADLRRAPINYFDLVRTVQNPGGAPMPDFDTPWKRLAWIVTGRNDYPAKPLHITPHFFGVGLLHSAFILFVFELGPVALVLFLLGLWRQWRGNAARTALLVGCLAIAGLFASALMTGPMLPLFNLPTLIFATLFAGAGADALIARVAGRPGSALRSAAAGVALVALMLLPGPWLRDYADAHPFTRWQFHVEEEGRHEKAAVIPSMRADREAGEYGDRAAAILPRGSLVVAGWAELNVLRYLQAVKGVRLDLTLQQSTPTTLIERLEIWQRAHDVARHPIVLAIREPSLGWIYAGLDSIPMGEDSWLWIRKTPIPAASAAPQAR